MCALGTRNPEDCHSLRSRLWSPTRYLPKSGFSLEDLLSAKFYKLSIFFSKSKNPKPRVRASLLHNALRIIRSSTWFPSSPVDTISGCKQVPRSLCQNLVTFSHWIPVTTFSLPPSPASPTHTGQPSKTFLELPILRTVWNIKLLIWFLCSSLVCSPCMFYNAYPLVLHRIPPPQRDNSARGSIGTVVIRESGVF